MQFSELLGCVNLKLIRILDFN